MTAELTRGQNHPLPRARLEIRVSAGTPVVAGATLGDENGTIHGVEQVAHPGAPTLPGLEVSRQAAADHRLAVDLDAVSDAVHRVSVLLALPVGGRGPARFGAVAAPFIAVTDLDGGEVASYTITGLEAETAVVALELYRRQGAWKVRAVGQGYAGGLAELLADQKLSQAHQLAASIHEAVASGLARSIPAPPATAPAHRPDHGTAPRTGPGAPVPPPTSPYDPQGASAPGPQTPPAAGRPGAAQPYPGGPGEPAATGQPSASAPAGGGPIDYSHPRRQNAAPPPPPPAAPPAEPGQSARPVAGDATGWSMEERLYNQVWGMFEDLARTTAAYRSAVDFAESRMEKELDQVLSDPRSRIGGQGDAAREAARSRHGRLVSQAREVLDRDVAQLVAEGRGRRARPAGGLRTLGQPRLARLPRPHGDPDGPAAGRSPSAGGRPDTRPDADPAAAGARSVDRQRTLRLARRFVRRLPRDAAPGPGDGRRPRGPAARCLPGGRVHRARHRPGRIRGAGTGATGAERGARRAARPGSGGGGGRVGPSHPARRPGPDGVARRCSGRAAARCRHVAAAADRQRLPARFRRPGRQPAALPRRRGGRPSVSI
ncbi:hypothetical protein RKD37_006672 [Streptomyces ambofaciens]